jgi:putative hydrolase of the HAD superfamily
MNRDIEAIFMDIGNTLRVVVRDAPYQAQARQRLASLVGTTESSESFCARLDERYETYRKWACETLREASEKELWTRWMLPDWPADQIAPLSELLTLEYRRTLGRRIARPGADRVIAELFRRGYYLGIVSNTIAEREVPMWLAEVGLDGYFSTIVLSSVAGRRKPDPAMLQEAARQARVPPARCAYVGDNPARDVVGCRLAGFGMVVLLDPLGEKTRNLREATRPDLIICDLRDLLDVFPPRSLG